MMNLRRLKANGRENSAAARKKPTPPVQKSFYPIDTKGLCILCYRENIPVNGVQTSKKSKEEFSVKFCTQLLRHLKLDVQKHIIQQSVSFPRLKKYKKIGVVLCEDCSILARSFCASYSELENVKMKVDECAKNVSDIVRLSGRIPTRLKAYQDRMGFQKAASVQGMPNSSNSSTPSPLVQQVAVPNAFTEALQSKGPGPGPDKRPNYVVAQTLRNQILHKSSQILRKSLPRVVVQKCDTPKLASSVETESNPTKDDSDSSKVGNSNDSPEKRASPIEVDALPTHSLEHPSPCELSPENAPSAIVPSSPTAITEDPICDLTPCTPSTSTPDASTSNQDQRKNSITISECGKTVLLPHQVFKVETPFYDESAMEYEDTTYVTIDISQDEFQQASIPSTVENINPLNNPIQIDNIEQFSTVELKQEKDSFDDGLIDLNEKTCKECRITLSCRAELEKHRSLIHKDHCYVQCPVCKQLLPSYSSLKQHRVAEAECSISEADEIREYEFVAKSIFPFAKKLTGNKFCPVEDCFEVFAAEDALNLHLKTHGSFACNFCSDKRTFNKAHELALHESEEHSGIGKKFYAGYKCSRCPFHVVGQYTYLLHFLDIHLKIDPFNERCELCKKGFTKTAVLDLRNKKTHHFQTHHEIKGKDPKYVHLCDLCQAPFLKKCQLTEHLVQTHHQGISHKHVCNFCGIAMPQSILAKHKLVVHNNTPVHEVEAEFRRKTRNRLTGNGKGFTCGCGNPFNTKTNLKRHVKLIHNGVMPISGPTGNDAELDNEGIHEGAGAALDNEGIQEGAGATNPVDEEQQPQTEDEDVIDSHNEGRTSPQSIVSTDFDTDEDIFEVIYVPRKIQKKDKAPVINELSSTSKS